MSVVTFIVVLSFWCGSRAAWPCCVAVTICIVIWSASDASNLEAVEPELRSASHGCIAAVAKALNPFLFLMRAQ
jgi:hypothetical protein